MPRLNVGIISPHGSGGAIPDVTRPITVSGGIDAGDDTMINPTVVVQFGAGGPSVQATINVQNQSWTCVGEPVASIRGTQTFVISAFANCTFPRGPDDPIGSHPFGSDSASVTVRMADVFPTTLTISPFTTDITSATLPVSFILTGATFDPDSQVTSVQIRLDSGAFQLADNLIGNWSHWEKGYSLHAGHHCFTVIATDAGGHVSQQVAFLSIKPAGAPAPDTGSITSWTRLEPHCTNVDIASTTSARLFDPLWMMTRQWQVGEYQAEDAGSPVQARVRATSATLSRCFIGALPANTTAVAAPQYDPLRMPLEAMVERRRARPATADEARLLGLSVEGGLHFLRMLELAALTKSYRAVFVTKFALQNLADSVAATTDDTTRRFMQTTIGRAVDARRLATTLRGIGAAQLVLDTALAIATADRPKVQAAAVAWLAWYDALFSEPANAADDGWIPSRLEYAVSVGTRLSPAAADDVTMSASEFDDGEFDWHNFDVNPGVTMGTTGDTTFTSTVETTVPSPIHFRGAPAQRFWEIEDSLVAYGIVPAGATDLAHLLMIEYATTYGNDWFVLPLTVPVGSVTRVDSLVVTDTFGVKTLLRPIGDQGLGQPFWSMWQPSYVRQVGAPLATNPIASNRFFLPPSIGQVIDGGPLEDVLFMRDEMANIAWAIERSLESPVEQAVARTSETPASVPQAISGPLPRYRLSSTVPENWIPLLPVQQRLDGKVVTRLRRGAVLQVDGSPRFHLAQGDVLNAAPELQLHDEDVPREGVRVTKSRRMARWTDGSTWLWTAFRKEVGRGEGSSGLQFDQLTPPDGSLALLAPDPPAIIAPTLASTTLVIGGASVTQTATLGNSGPDLLDVTLQAWIVQGTARRAAADAPVDCGRGAGVVPNGVSTVSGPITVSNSANGVGTLVPGAATVELQLLQDSIVLSTTSAPIPVTLVPNPPPSITSVTANPSFAFIGGPATPYSATLTNPGTSRSNISLQGFVNQGTARRSAGGAGVVCGAGTGVLPTGTFTVPCSMLPANTNGGVGTLVPGPATFELQLLDGTTVLGTKTIAVTLQPSTVGIASLTSTAATVAMGSVSPYAATLRNPGANLSNVVLQGYLNQGTVHSAAGGIVVIAGAGNGILPSGFVNVTGSISAFNGGGGGVLVPGPATFELQMIMNGALLEAKTVPVTLT